MKTANIKMWGRDVEIGFSRESYANNGNLAIQAWEIVDGVFAEPYAMVTVNFAGKLKENRAYIDNNNCPKEIINWLEEEGYAICTYGLMRSGFCEYYEYMFTDEFLTNVVA